MTSPDLTPFIDLTIDDRDPQDVFEAALQILQVNLPDWTPREGNTEVLLLEAMALEVAELIFAINRVPNNVMQAILAMHGVERDNGAAPLTALKFFVSTPFDYIIPAGTAVRLDLIGGLPPIVFTTDVDLTIVGGVGEGVVNATGDRFTSDGNGVESPQLVELLDSLVYVDRVEIATFVTSGREAEDDSEYFQRAVNRLGRLTDVLLLPRHFTSFALERPEVNRCLTLDNYNPGADLDGNGPVGNDGGHVTLALYGESGPLSGTEKTSILNEINNLKAANLQVHIIDPTITVVNVTVTVKKYASFDSAQVQAGVEAALANYLSTDTWEWGGVVRRFELVQEISNAPGVDYIETLRVPNTDLALSGVAPLASLGIPSVTVI